MRINNNMMAKNTFRQLGVGQANTTKSMEKLSSGLRINRAGDDAAGLAISEKMRGQIRGLNQASRNAQDGISMVQTAEGALNESHEILQRMRELAVQASNSTLEAEDRTAIGEEIHELKQEIDRIATDTEFNGKKLLDGSLETTLAAGSATKVGSDLSTSVANSVVVSDIDVSGAAANTTYTFTDDDAGNITLTGTVNGNSVSQTVTANAFAAEGEQTLEFDTLGISITLTGSGAATAAAIGDDVTTDLATITTDAANDTATFAIGANSGQNMTVTFGNMSSSQLGDASDLNTKISDNTNVSTVAKAQTLITELDGAITDVSTQRGKLGAAQNRLEHSIKNLDTSSENLQAAESRIRDVDMAKEMMEFTKNNILQQAAQSMLAQANQQPQGVLQLLR